MIATSSLYRFLVTLAVMSATLIQVLDTTIVNVALPHMQGALGATPSEVSWILTSYLVASAMIMPLTGYFTDLLGRKNYLLVCIFGFVVSSTLCGAATSLFEMVLFRILQGVFGASLVPLSQAIMTDVFPLEDRGAAMAIWGIGIMAGPVLGPTVGGYLIEMANWRWTFYINLPIGIFSLILAWYIVPDTQKKPRRMDWFALFLILSGIATLQFFLDRGNQEDWFDSTMIRSAAFIGSASLIGFLYYSLKYKSSSVFDLRIFKDRNFTTSSIIMGMFGLGLSSTMMMMPLMLESLFNYSALAAGIVLAPRGISAMMSMIIVGKMINRFNPKLLITFGILLSIIGTWIGTSYNLSVNSFWLMWPLIIQGFGMGFVFVPLSMIAFSTLPQAQRAEAAGIFSLLRTMGSSVGISFIATLYTRHSQLAWNEVGGMINPFNPYLHHYLNALHLKMTDPLAINVLGLELLRQTQMISFMNVFVFITLSYSAILPFIFLLKTTRLKTQHAPLEI